MLTFKLSPPFFVCRWSTIIVAETQQFIIITTEQVKYLMG